MPWTKEDIDRLFRDVESDSATEACKSLIRQTLRVKDEELIRDLKKVCLAQKRSWGILYRELEGIKFEDLNKKWVEKYGVIFIPGRGKTHLISPLECRARSLCGKKVTLESFYSKKVPGNGELCKKCLASKNKTWKTLEFKSPFTERAIRGTLWANIIGFTQPNNLIHLLSEGKTRTLCGHPKNLPKSNSLSFGYCGECTKKATFGKLSALCEKKLKAFNLLTVSPKEASSGALRVVDGLPLDALPTGMGRG